MEPRSSSPLAESAVEVVEAPTLKDALRLVRQRYGDDARVVRSRTVTRRQRGRLGSERVVEVQVEASGGSRRRASVEARDRAPAAAAAPPAGASLEATAALAQEVARIESLVRRVASERRRPVAGRPPAPAGPVAEALVAGGADPWVVARLCERFAAETGRDPGDRTAVLAYLEQSLPASGGCWEDLGGQHVFLGPAGCGKTELVLAVAARLQRLSRQVLVLALLPRHGGEVRRLQIEAARAGYDAAILQKPQQLEATAAHLARYDAVLVDTPAWDLPPLAEATALRDHIARNASFHRHLVCPLDRDPRDAQALVERAREWNCDWTALVRLDQAPRPAKLLDLLEAVPLPVSLLNRGPAAADAAAVAGAGALIDLLLAGGAADADGRRTARA